MRNVCLILLAMYMVVGCGRKEPPQAWIDKGQPRIDALKVTNAISSKRVTLTLAGGEGGLGYQVERSELDPYCQCPSTWTPFAELPPARRNEGTPLDRMLVFEIGGHYYAYRIRAIDALGRLGKWSKTLQADEK